MLDRSNGGQRLGLAFPLCNNAGIRHAVSCTQCVPFVPVQVADSGSNEITRNEARVPSAASVLVRLAETAPRPRARRSYVVIAFFVHLRECSGTDDATEKREK